MSGNPSGNPLWSDLDQPQIIQRGYQESNDTHRVDIAGIDPSIVIPVVQGGLQVLGSFNIPAASIHTATPFVITAGLAGITQQIMVADTTGQTDKILYGSTTIYTNPGCERQYNAQIPAGTAVSIQSAESSDPVAGNYVITFLG